jgi:rhodanese-related sulfurtransferase
MKRLTNKNIGLLAVLALLACVIGLWAWQMRYAVSANADDVMEVREAYERAQKGEIVLVDVRRPGEWRSTGIPAGARTITMHQNSADFLAGLLAAAGGRHDKPIALICATGGRTSWLMPHVHKAGFKTLYNVAEGMHGSRHGPGWLKKGLPVKK